MNPPNTIESLLPASGQYSFRQDLRLNRWLLVAVVVYLLEQYWERTHADWAPVARGLAALLPAVPGLFYVRSWIRFVRGMDELQRRLQVEAFLFATLITLGLGTMVSTLNARGVGLGPLTHGLTVGWMYMVMILLWTFRTVVLRFRYQ